MRPDRKKPAASAPPVERSAPSASPPPADAGAVTAAIARAVARRDATAEEMQAVMEQLMADAATPAQIASLLTALAMKGETVDELVGAARAMRGRMTRVTAPGPVVDTCGTGGDGKGTFNVSTAAALVAAGAGVAVAKHGNRAVSGRVGSADVLEALGVRIDLPAAAVAQCLADVGIGFCFAPRFHAAMRFAAAPRREIGVRTMLNLLGPLANPAGADRQLVGVFAPAWTEPMAAVLGRLGARRALVVHATDGTDEVSATVPTRVSEVADGFVRTYDLRPEEFGLARAVEPPPCVTDAAGSAAIIRAVLDGAPGGARDAVLVNTAAVLVVAGATADWPAAMAAAAAAIDDGRARDALRRLVEISQRAVA
jgi:anthranilate phosphoribosyltransferase/anthranilate synthase/phosphoribosyltransferase